MITNISNAYIGDASISRIYQGDELVYVTGHPDIRLEWIANGPNGGAANPDVYFDTGFSPQLSTRAEVKCETPALDVARVFGCGNSAVSSMFNLNMYATGNTQEGGTKASLKFFYRGGNISASFTPVINTPYTISLFGTYSGNTASEINMIVDGVKYTRSIKVSTNITDAQSAYIFRWHGNVNEIPSGVKFYYVKIWEANNLIRFYIPVLHYINGQYTPCFYDKVNDTYIYNLGTDTPTYKISGDYLLDYITNGPDDNSGVKRVYYDTGVIPNSSINVEISCSSYTIDKSVNLPIISGADANWRGFGIFLPMNYGNVTSRLGGSYVDGPQIVSNTKYIITTYQSTSTQGDMIVNGTAYSHATTDVYGTTSAYLFAYNVNGTVNTSASHTGMKIYYTNFESGNIPSKSFVPVLHNNQAAFLDLNSGTYIYNIGTSAPYYQFKR